MVATTIKLIIFPTIRNSEKVRSTDQSQNVIIDKL